MSETSDSGAVDYKSLVTDQALLSVFMISSVVAFGSGAVPVALPTIGEAFSLTESEIGLIMSVFEFGVFVMLPVVSILSDVYGRRSMVIFSLLLLGVSGIATLWVNDYTVLLLLRVLQGIGFAGTLPLVTTMIGDLYTGPAGSSAQGMRDGLNGLAHAGAPIVGGFLAVIAWQYPFVLFAATFPVAALVYRYYPETATILDQSDSTTSFLDDLREYAKNIIEAVDRRLSLLLIGGFTLFFLKGTFRTFLPVFVVLGLGSPVTAAGLLLGVYGGTRAIVAPLTGSIVARVGRKYMILMGVALGTLGIGLIPFTPNVQILGILAVVYGLGEAFLNPVLNEAVASSATAERRGGIVGGLLVSKQAALVVSPALIGAIIGIGGYTIAFLATAALGLVYGVVILRSVSNF